MTPSGRMQQDTFEPLIHRNTTIPVHKNKEFFTVYPGQEAIHIHVYQGEHKQASKNTLLGDFMVDGLKPKSAMMGFTSILVNFAIDVNGILDIAVNERGTKTRAQHRLKVDRQRLNPEQIAASQAKLAEIYQVEDVDDGLEVIDLDPGVMALFERARTVLETPGVDEELARDISTTIENIRQAEADGKKTEAEEFCDELIDLLMEAEDEELHAV